MFIESIRRNWLPLHHSAFSPFCDFTCLPPKSPFSTLPLENLDEVQRCSELLHRDGLRHHVCWILLCTDLHQVDHIVIYDPLTYFVIPYIMLHPFVIFVILSKRNNTLTVAMNPNQILQYTESLDQSSQPQSFF